MSNNNIKGGDAPVSCALEANKNYAWCTCGHSENQPFCNGKHKTESATPPMIFSIAENKTAFLCSCKMTKNPPYCDGSHK